MSRLNKKVVGIINFTDYKKKSYLAGYGIIMFILMIATIMALAPIFWLFFTSFKSLEELNSTTYQLFPERFDFQKVLKVWNEAKVGQAFINTFIVVAGAIVCSVLFNGLIAYAIVILKPKGAKKVNNLIMLSYMMPAIVGMIPLVTTLFKLGFADSFIPLCLIFGANAFYFVAFKNYYSTIPKALFEAARIDGASDLRMFFSLVLPLSKPIVGVVAIFTMTAAFSDFALPYQLLLGDEKATIMVLLVRIQAAPQAYGIYEDQFLMLLMLSIMPQIILFIFFQKQITNSVASTGMKE